MGVNGPVILHDIDARGTGIRSVQLAVELEEPLPADPLMLDVEYPAGQRIEHAANPALGLSTRWLGAGRRARWTGGKGGGGLRPAHEAHLVQEDHDDLLGPGRCLG